MEVRAAEKNQDSRLKEIMSVLNRHHIIQGISPEKLKLILEDLGPTYVKLGQIMSLHSDILPKRYCDELMLLNSDVDPMPFAEVERLLNREYGDWKDYFSSIEQKPIGSASIAQVHRATLKSGEDVIIKVQRDGIYDVMSRDIELLHKLAKLTAPVPNLREMVDLDMVLDELWSVAQEEMNFLKEADNMEEFARNNELIRYVRTPKLYRAYTTRTVLVMEYIGGYAINDAEGLKEEGYDLEEIGTKFVNSFLRQVMVDGFFHADPHPGNVKIHDGKIVWLDMGMMGRLSDKDRKIMEQAIEGIAIKDVDKITDAVLQLGEFWGKQDRNKLFRDIRQFLNDYGNQSFGSIDIAETMEALMDIMKENHIGMPHGMTMLVRGLTHMEGVLAEIAPDINMMAIAANRVGEDFLKNINWRGELQRSARHLYRSSTKAVEIPSMMYDILAEYLKGESRFNLRLESTESLNRIIESSVRNLVIGVCITALLISSSIICTTNMTPRVLGIPLLGFIGYAVSIAAIAFFLIRFLIRKIRRRKNR